MGLAPIAKKLYHTNRKHTAFLSLPKRNQWLQCSERSERNSIAMLLPWTSKGNWSSLKRAGVSVKAKVLEDCELQRKIRRDCTKLARNPRKSSCCVCKLVIPKHTVWSELKNQLQLKPYRLQLVQALKTITTKDEWNFAIRCYKCWRTTKTSIHCKFWVTKPLFI